MATLTQDLKFKISGGLSNTDSDLSLGGAISSTEFVTATLHNLFDIVNSSETTNGDVEYRCIYTHNTHATLTLLSSIFYADSATLTNDTSFAFGLGTSAINGVEQTIANESTAPAGVTFTTGFGVGNAVSIGDLPAGQHKATWLRRTIEASASALDLDSVTIKLDGDTTQ